MKKLFILFSGLTILTSCGVESNSNDDIDGVPRGDHRIFVSSLPYTGQQIQNLDNADTICQGLAEDAGLFKDYVAIISDSTESAADRITLSGSIYKVDAAKESTLIVAQASDIFNGDSTTLLDYINYDETGKEVSELVWTGTTNDGSTYTGTHCNNWSSVVTTGFYGATTELNGDWIELASADCDEEYRIYCISQ